MPRKTRTSRPAAPVNKSAKSPSKGNNHIIVVDKNDDRLLTGELVGVNKGKHWKQNI